MELLDKIFTILNFSPAQKEQARKDFDVFIRAKTVEQLLEEFPQSQRAGLNADNAAEALKKFYSPAVIEERTRMNLQNVLKEYIDFLLQGGSEQEKQAIAKALQEAAR